ncbi:MAG: hypothetical protein PHS95_02910 [Candidatus Pacebacteria bacterium]|nr:hypothetical protein [Candidatus Paceibacterota bacterium]
MKNKKMVWLIVAFVVVAVVSFYAGSKYAGTKKPVFTQNGFNQSGTNTVGQRGMRGGGGLTSGEILSMDAQSITVKLRDGGSRIVFYTDKTSVSKMVSGTIKDLSVGTQVNITGTSNADGSVNADSVQIRPALGAQATSTPKTSL